jgi:methionine-gamma-lyase
VVAGIVVTREEELLAGFRETAKSFGTTMDPHQAWLVLRGIRSLGMRVERSQENARVLAPWLERHPAVAWVRYPGLPSHPQHELATHQMDGPGSVIAFELRGGVAAGRQLMDTVQLITLAVSLGGVESLIEHPASMTHRGVAAQEQRKQGITPGLVRLAVGCEDLEDLRADLEQGLAQVGAAVPETLAP